MPSEYFPSFSIIFSIWIQKLHFRLWKISFITKTRSKNFSTRSFRTKRPCYIIDYHTRRWELTMCLRISGSKTERDRDAYKRKISE